MVKDYEIRRELRDAAKRGIDEFLRSTRGAKLCGSNAITTTIGEKELQIKLGSLGGLRDYYLIKVSKGM